VPSLFLYRSGGGENQEVRFAEKGRMEKRVRASSIAGSQRGGGRLFLIPEEGGAGGGRRGGRSTNQSVSNH